MPANLLQVPLFCDLIDRLDVEAPEDRLASQKLDSPAAPPPATAPSKPTSPQTNTSLSDEGARTAALDIHRSWIVEAPAGSGKTGLLIQRLLKLLAEGDITAPAEVLAITFTRKAAQELRNRVLEQLTAAAGATPLSLDASAFDRSTRSLAQAVLRRDGTLGWHLLESPQQLNIRTIDSFCGELVRGMPVLAGGVGQRQPVDDASAFYEEAAERVLRELGGPDPVLDGALRCLLLHRDARVGDCIDLVAGMLAAREQWGELVPLATSELTEERLNGPVRAQLEGTLEFIVKEGLTRAQKSLPAGWLEDLSAFAARMSLEPGYKGCESPVCTLAGLPDPPGTEAVDFQRWLTLVNLVLTNDGTPRTGLKSNLLGFELPKAARPELQHLIRRLQAVDLLGTGALAALCSLRDLPATTLSEEQWAILKAVFHVLRRALVELEILFASKGVCDFTALSLTARDLLHPDRNLAADFRQPGLRLQHLLVDEMQDTSVGQYELFAMLTRSWDGFSQTVFLVGDPKQSIYAFRQARVERFLRTERTGRLGEVPLGALRLTANFRSQAELVSGFNRTFRCIFPAPEERTEDADTGFQTVEVPFTAAVPVRRASASPALHWHPHIYDPYDVVDPPLSHDPRSRTSSGSGRAVPDGKGDAHSIRCVIENFIHRWPATAGNAAPLKAPKIAVLARSRAHLGPVIAEFKQDRGNGPMPFRAVEIEVLNERPEVLDLLALTRALLHPGDRIAWLAVLRSPVCGLSLADLLALTGEGPEAEITATVAHLVQERRHLLSSEGQRLLDRAWATLNDALQTLGTSSLPTHVERTWRSLGGDVFLDENSLANARRFLLLLHELDAGGSLNLPAVERRLRRLYAEATDVDAAVELMTIHKSKGLEWDLVLVPALERGSGRPEGELLRWFELDASSCDRSPILLAPVSAKGEEGSRLWQWLGKLKVERELAEAKRLLYVACTRAREELHLFGTAKLTKAGTLEVPKAASLLRAAWPAALPAFTAALDARGALGSKGAASHPASLGGGSTREPLAFRLPRTADAAPLALAAGADTFSPDVRAKPPVVRLPVSFDPLARFRAEAGPQLPYLPSSALRRAAPFARPAGSFAARAFGNVVHRFLDLLARRLEAGQFRNALLKELPQWSPRLHQAFRAEGLPPPLCEREASRALRALQETLLEDTGFWLLGPHQAAWSERNLQVGGFSSESAPSTLRADRVFLADSEPLSAGATHLWIVDFKTSEQGGRSEDAFFTSERQKYADQLQVYARACLAAMDAVQPVVLALFYPLIPRLVYWPFAPEIASKGEMEQEM